MAEPGYVDHAPMPSESDVACSHASFSQLLQACQEKTRPSRQYVHLLDLKPSDDVVMGVPQTVLCMALCPLVRVRVHPFAPTISPSEETLARR